LTGLGGGSSGGESTAHPCRAELGIEFGDRLDDLLTREFIAGGFAFGVGGQEIDPGGHQRFVFCTGRGPVGDRFGVEVPAFAALGHPQPAGLLCTRLALVLPGGSAGDGDDVGVAGGGVDAAHG
jgi:hypothetical protein